jgi:hypothetical protein
MHQLLIAFGILAMGLFMIHVLRSEAFASNRTIAILMMFALFAAIRNAIASSEALAMPKGD